MLDRENMTCRFSVNDDCKSFYDRNGYVILSDLFSDSEIAAIYHDVLSLFQLRFGGNSLKEAVADPHASRKDEWRACARQMQNTLAQLHAGTKPEITKLLKKLGMRSPSAWVLPEIRADMSMDRRYMQPWHQDWRSGQGSFNSVTIWTPLHDVKKENGAIEVIAGSHLDGYRDVDVIQDPLRYIMKNPLPADAFSFVAELKRGECILFSQMLLHASGDNTSGLPRLTCQFRFADRAESHFMNNNYRAPQTTDLVWEHPPTAADMAKTHGVT
jgi:phytanoyl-CoA hydroxylase